MERRAHEPENTSSDYPRRYKAQILSAIESIDLGKVGEVIRFFKDARAQGRRIFVCGDAGIDSVASDVLCDMVKRSSLKRSSRFRILALSDHLLRLGYIPDNPTHDRVFVEQLKNFAEPEDVVMGICHSGSCSTILNAIEYASWIGCRTIAVTGSDGGRLEELADLHVSVPAARAGTIEDAHVIICHMIGQYFADVEESNGA